MFVFAGSREYYRQGKLLSKVHLCAVHFGSYSITSICCVSCIIVVKKAVQQIRNETISHSRLRPDTQLTTSILAGLYFIGISADMLVMSHLRIHMTRHRAIM